MYSYNEKNKSGLIINITSILGYFGIPYRGIYCSSKSSLEIIGEVLSMELKNLILMLLMSHLVILKLILPQEELMLN